jgi:hypothetical protein
VAKGYCDNTNILWQKDFFNKSEIGGAKPLSQRQKFCGERILQQCKYFVAKRLFQQSRYSWRQGVVTTDKFFMVRGYCNNKKIEARGLFQQK